MEQRQQSQKERSVAWFKLADLISRGEREKALSVFRLLSHSLADKAYVLQVEGDMLWFMEDESACCEKYKQAAFLYQKEKRWVDAIAIHEHIRAMRPASGESLAALLILYALIDWPERCEERLMALVNLYQQRVIDAPQLEKALKDVAEAVVSQGASAWFGAWFAQMQTKLPAEVLTKLPEAV
jgi:tetratricopeptide (TPR) repeat protein